MNHVFKFLPFIYSIFWYSRFHLFSVPCFIFSNLIPLMFSSTRGLSASSVGGGAEALLVLSQQLQPRVYGRTSVAGPPHTPPPACRRGSPAVSHRSDSSKTSKRRRPTARLSVLGHRLPLVLRQHNGWETEGALLFKGHLCHCQFLWMLRDGPIDGEAEWQTHKRNIYKLGLEH